MKKILTPIFCLMFFAGCIGSPSTPDSTIPDDDPIDTDTTETEEVAEVNCIALTTHDTCIIDGIDSALLGSWKLIEQSISSPAGSITNPFAGRTLTFLGTSNYTEDYSTEETDDQTAAGITSSCEVLGVLGGAWEADAYSDLDLDPPIVINVLHITPDGGSPSVKCQATGEPVYSNQASTPLGVGPSTGDYVEYTYTLNEELTFLTIIQENPYASTTNVYTFSKIS